MDKNTITGLVIIFLILIGFSYFTRPSEEEIRERQRQDSIARVEQQKMELAARQQKEDIQMSQNQTSATTTSKESVFIQDSLSDQTFILENNKIKSHFFVKYRTSSLA